MAALIHQIVAWVQGIHVTGREWKIIGTMGVANGVTLTAMLKMWWTRITTAMYGRAGRVYLRVVPHRIRWFLGDDIEAAIASIKKAESEPVVQDEIKAVPGVESFVAAAKTEIGSLSNA
jgi:hypothetical protein